VAGKDQHATQSQRNLTALLMHIIVQHNVTSPEHSALYFAFTKYSEIVDCSWLQCVTEQS